MTPGEIFDPAAALDPTRFAGASGAQHLLEAARLFPGGPTMLVFALFWAPVGPGIPAGVLLARHIPLNPAVTFGLYTLSDVLGALVCGPLFAFLRRHGRKVKAVHWLGRRLLAFAMLGVPRARPAEGGAGRGPEGDALLRIATVGFAVDVYSAGLLATGLAGARVAGWAAAVAGDLVWFALLLGASIATARVVDDDRVIGLVVIAAMLILPRLVPTRVFASGRH